MADAFALCAARYNYILAETSLGPIGTGSTPKTTSDSFALLAAAPNADDVVQGSDTPPVRDNYKRPLERRGAASQQTP